MHRFCTSGIFFDSILYSSNEIDDILTLPIHDQGRNQGKNSRHAGRLAHSFAWFDIKSSIRKTRIIREIRQTFDSCFLARSNHSHHHRMVPQMSEKICSYRTDERQQRRCNHRTHAPYLWCQSGAWFIIATCDVRTSGIEKNIGPRGRYLSHPGWSSRTISHSSTRPPQTQPTHWQSHSENSRNLLFFLETSDMGPI